MATVIDQQTELEEFHRFIEHCRETIRPALEASLRGESEPLDMEDIKRRGRERFEERKRAN